ncbi:hypothetical protein [Candidatus Avelusimicrobium caledoniensis]|uniref:hypothetical protein n=1 Tax=Candidatus Avelusimicrobium caledoniensis TaxID=3416220 RepID=UPI003D11EC07
MQKILTRFLNLNVWVQIVFCLCMVGALTNTVLVARDIFNDGILLRLHIGFLILYAGQVVFILLEERQVWALAVLQGIMALLTNADFTCMPLVRFVGNIIYTLWPEPSLEYMKVYRYLMTSSAFTLQLLSAFILFSLLPKSTVTKPVAD